MRPDDIDVAWLNDALAERHPGVRVADVEIVRVDELTNTHVRLRVSYEEPAGAPERMFAKLPPLDPARRESLAASNMGPRESRFYAELAPVVTMRVPAMYVARYDDSDRSFVQLLEDLDATGCTVPDGRHGVTPDAAARALEDLADLHLQFEDPARRTELAGWVPETSPTSNYGATLLQYGLDHHRDRLSDDFAAIAELYIHHDDVLQALWREGPATVVHGDPHLGNLFDDDGRTGFLDWGLIKVSTPMRDVSYFLTMSMSIEDRRAHERDLLRFYLDLRKAGGGSEITFDEAWFAHRVHASYNVPASCQVVTFPENMSDRRRIFSDAFLDRAQASLDDLEARDALREVAGV
jgi:hypothetical protein